jgi:hypothetical protein
VTNTIAEPVEIEKSLYAVSGTKELLDAIAADDPARNVIEDDDVSEKFPESDVVAARCMSSSVLSDSAELNQATSSAVPLK